MFLINHRNLKVFVCSRVVDMRGGFESLGRIVVSEMGCDLLAGHVFLFFGRNRRRAKALLFDGTGLTLVHKRLETGRFMRPEDFLDFREITLAELGLILDGTRLRLPLSTRAYNASDNHKRYAENHQ
jgi:transposase